MPGRASLESLPAGLLPEAIARHLDARSAIALAGTCRAIRAEMRSCVVGTIDARDRDGPFLLAALERGTIAGCAVLGVELHPSGGDVLRAAVASASPPRELEVSGGASIVGRALLEVRALGRTVETLRVHGCMRSMYYDEPFAGLGEVARAFPNVRTLELAGFRAEKGGGDRADGGWERVETLRVVACGSSAPLLPHPLPRLESLDLSIEGHAPAMVDLGGAYPRISSVRVDTRSERALGWLDEALARLAERSVRVDLALDLGSRAPLAFCPGPRARGAVRRIRIERAFASRSLAAAVARAGVPVSIRTLVVDLEDLHHPGENVLPDSPPALPLPERIAFKVRGGALDHPAHRDAALGYARWLREATGRTEIFFDAFFPDSTMRGGAAEALLLAAAARASRWQRVVAIEPRLAAGEASTLAASGCAVDLVSFFVGGAEANAVADSIAAAHANSSDATEIRLAGPGSAAARKRISERCERLGKRTRDFRTVSDLQRYWE